MGFFSAGALADGQLPTMQGAIYTVPGQTTSYIKQLFLFNSNAAEQTIQLWLNTNGTARPWRTLVLAQNESADVLEHGESVTLTEGQSVEASTTTAAAVSYTITGVEET